MAWSILKCEGCGSLPERSYDEHLCAFKKREAFLWYTATVGEIGKVVYAVTEYRPWPVLIFIGMISLPKRVKGASITIVVRLGFQPPSSLLPLVCEDILKGAVDPVDGILIAVAGDRLFILNSVIGAKIVYSVDVVRVIVGI